MISSNPLHEEIFIDLYQRSPKKGLNIKAFEAIKQQQTIEALDSILNLLSISHDLVGEKKGIIIFMQDPLSWGLWITGPVVYKPNVVYAHCIDQVEEFIIDSRSTLVKVANFIVERKKKLSGDKDMALRPPPKQDDELQCILMNPERSSCTYFEEAERAIDRDCLLDACTSLFRPFGLQPRHKDGQVVFQTIDLQYQIGRKTFQYFFKLSSTKDALVLKHLQPRSQPLIWIERLDTYFDSVAVAPSKPPPYKITRPSPSDPQPWLSRGMHTMVLLFLHPSVKPLVAMKGRYVPKILNTAFYLSFEAAHPDTDLENALVFNLASPVDRVALIQCVLSIRNLQRINHDQEEDRKIWYGKICEEEDKERRNRNYKVMLGKLNKVTEMNEMVLLDSISSGEETDSIVTEEEEWYDGDVDTLLDERDSSPLLLMKTPRVESYEQKGRLALERHVDDAMEELTRMDSGNEGDTEPEDYVPRRRWKRLGRIRMF